jgi:hypothetical protein
MVKVLGTSTGELSLRCPQSIFSPAYLLGALQLLTRNGSEFPELLWANFLGPTVSP